MKTITLKKTGETICFVKTGKDTNGAYAEIICTVPAGKKGPPSHIHPLQDENFEVIEGKLELSAGSKKIILEPGQSFNVTARKVHTFSNPYDCEMKFKATYKPALNIDYFLVQSFNELNNHPNIKKSLVQLIVDFEYTLKQIPGQFVIAGIPTFVLSFFAAFGRLFIKPKVNSLEEHNASFDNE